MKMMMVMSYETWCSNAQAVIFLDFTVKLANRREHKQGNNNWLGWAQSNNNEAYTHVILQFISVSVSQSLFSMHAMKR